MCLATAILHAEIVESLYEYPVTYDNCRFTLTIYYESMYIYSHSSRLATAPLTKLILRPDTSHLLAARNRK
jgi:hypothetical protein